MAIIKGGSGIDLLNGDPNFPGESDTIYGFGGADILNGFGGNDTIYAGSGNDTVNGGVGDDDLFGESGNDTMDGGDGEDEMLGGSGNDVMDGGEGSDRLNGGSGNDIMTGGEDGYGGGDDGYGTTSSAVAIIAEDGCGGCIGDEFVFTPGCGSDIITDFEVGIDELVLEDGLKIRTISERDVNSDGTMDTLVQFFGGSVALLGVTDVTAEQLVCTPPSPPPVETLIM